MRKAAPRAAITIVARPSVAPLFCLVPGIDAAIEWPTDRSGRARALQALKTRCFDAALLLPNSFQSALTAWRAGIPARWGYSADARSVLLTRSVRRPERVHQGAYYQYLVHELGVPNGPLEPRLEVSTTARDRAGQLLEASGWDGRTQLVAMAPGAAYGGAKRWPIESFVTLTAELVNDGMTVVVVGSRADAVVADDLMGVLVNMEGRVLNLSGRTDVPVLAGVLAKCRVLVTNDSGAMHVGAAVGTRVVAMFGPTDESCTHPLGSTHTILTSATWCRPCMLRECPLDHRCMRGIRVDVVLTAVRDAQ